MRMINVDRSCRVLDCPQRTLTDYHIQRGRHRSRRSDFSPHRPVLSRKLSTVSSNTFRSLLSKIQGGSVIDLEMDCGPSILETSLGTALISSFIDHFQPRRGLSPIRRARMAQSHIHPLTPKCSPSVSASRRKKLSPSPAEVIPIEIHDTDASESSDQVIMSSQKTDDVDTVIEIVDDSPCSITEKKTDLVRRSLFQIESQQNTVDNRLSSPCIENCPQRKTAQISSQVSHGLSKAKGSLIGGANKCHLPPNDAVLVLDDVTMGPKHKELSQGQGSSSLADEMEVNWVPSYPVYTALKEKLSKECRQIDYIRGDGNCFFRALSKQLYGNERYHKMIRNLIVDLIATNKPQFAQFVDGEDVQDHVECMCQEQSWATTCEIYAASTLLQRDIFMLTPDHLNETYSWLLFKPVFQCESQESSIATHPCYITMCNTNGNHYDRIVPEHGSCNCFLPHPELDGVSYSVDLTNDS